ncbi:exportin-6-like isoform X1 [Dinothrombium tinctorium]|uniref:Exportin-6-like isoform X1 n=1 Tax=Dinothrombium tinctorium TaxID=1965070 RepID=A0A443QTL7_9ACAR|nr:exportin-6-like isoform X1 [Dinothrombium tinctorium]RWS06392.1 exportin-6-like isoform X1 [Dinothrombium tinctorium]
MSAIASPESAECLFALESLMNEFFHPLTSNERKREIETTLNAFSEQQYSWSHCLKYLMHTNNEFTSMFCLSVVESVIAKRWLALSSNLKLEIKTCLWKYLMDKHKSVPLYIVNKTAKLIACIGRLDWPHFYPDFFSNIYQLIQSKNTSSLGLTLLETAIEELSTPRDDLSSTRKEELHKLLLNQIPQILSVLTNVMENTLDKHINVVTATPPPSPTHSQHPNPGGVFGNGADIINNAFELSLRRGLLDSAPHMDLDSLRISSQALSCISQLLAWLPLNQHQQISNTLLAAIFVCATFGCSVKQSLSKDLDVSQLGILAMNCINEIMSKNCISSDSTDFFYHLFQNTFHLLQTLIKEDGEISLIDNLQDDYVSKFTEFLRLFVGGHFPRYESHQSFPTVEFLALLFQFTFKQTSCERFLASLEIWSLFVDFVISRKKQRELSHGVDILEKYKTTLVSLLTQITYKFQFKLNYMILEELDNECLDDDCETEWQKFVNQSIEIIAKISDLLPSETYEIISSCLEENLNNFIGLEYFVSKDANGISHKLEIVGENDIRNLHCTMRDLSTSLKITGRLAVNFTSEFFNERFVIAKNLVEKLLHITVYSCRMKFYALQMCSSSLMADFEEVGSQLFATMKAYTYWLSQYGNEPAFNKNDDFIIMVTTLINQCIEVVCQSTPVLHPPIVVHSALLCLQSISVTVKPRFMLNLDSIKVLYSTVCNSVAFNITGAIHQKCLTLPLEIDDEYLLCNIISNIFLLPWINIGDAGQDWDERSRHHNMFIHSLVEPLFRITKSNHTFLNAPMQSDFKLILKRTLALLTNLVYNHSESPTRSKQLLFTGLRETIEQCISLLPLYLPHMDTGEQLLTFLFAAFEVLQNQIRIQLVEKTVNSMMALFAEANVAGTVLNSLQGNRLMKKFFKIFSLIAQQPGAMYKALLPSMLSLALNQLYPQISQSSSPDVPKSFYQFLHNFLLNNFKYFFKSNLLNSNRSQINDMTKGETDHEEEFMRIMQAYGQSFLSPDITLFKQNLESMENLNFRFKLYHKEVFRRNLLKQFLTLFMQTLVSKTHDILNDEISNVIYNLASVDFNVFFHQFILEFLCISDGLNDNQRNVLATTIVRNFATDLPSFTQNVQKFVNDFRYYRLCNSSL